MERVWAGGVNEACRPGIDLVTIPAISSGGIDFNATHRVVSAALA
jgi:hypothetical protein